MSVTASCEKKFEKKINLDIGLGQNNSIWLLNYDKMIKYELIIWWNMPMHNFCQLIFWEKERNKTSTNRKEGNNILTLLFLQFWVRKLNRSLTRCEDKRWGQFYGRLVFKLLITPGAYQVLSSLSFKVFCLSKFFLERRNQMVYRPNEIVGSWKKMRKFKIAI